MKEFNLGTKVVVSDPCYTIPTWCHAIVEDVLPGKYIGTVQMYDGGDWGNRVEKLRAVHENHSMVSHKIKWELFPVEIGVDSGQAGIFDFDHYRNDEHSESYDLPLIFGNDWCENEGDKWYQRMCSLTLGKKNDGISDDHYGSSPDGIVSSSGYGDGSYDLYVGKINNQIVGFEIVFITEDEDEDEDYDGEGFRIDEIVTNFEGHEDDE